MSIIIYRCKHSTAYQFVVRVLFRIFCLGEKIRVEIDGGQGVCG